MDFASNQDPQIKEMLHVIGVAAIEDLFQDIPASLQIKKPHEDDGLSEYEGLMFMEALAEKNSARKYESYLGGGAYEHHVPALVGAICQKSEFLTSYTPYQAEASQGMLQTIFEFQSAICALSGLDVANASLYDGASACAEALLMGLRVNKTSSKILIAESLNPHYRAVIDQYLTNQEIEIITIPADETGRLDKSALKEAIDDKTAALLVQSPNFFGVVEDFTEINTLLQKYKCLKILAANPLSYGLYKSAGEQGFDIAIGDCQPFGIPLQFGGPYVGYMACKQALARQLPGRLVGETVDIDGKRGFVLTMQAREQHIRRDKATSNICTNQALAALASLVAILWYGKEGVKQLALSNYQRAHYLYEELIAIEGISPLAPAPFFNEFSLKFACPLETLQNAFHQENIEPGIPLKRYSPELSSALLITVTETKSKTQLDHYVRIAKEIMTKNSAMAKT